MEVLAALDQPLDRARDLGPVAEARARRLEVGLEEGTQRLAGRRGALRELDVADPVVALERQRGRDDRDASDPGERHADRPGGPRPARADGEAARGDLEL